MIVHFLNRLFFLKSKCETGIVIPTPINRRFLCSLIHVSALKRSREKDVDTIIVNNVVNGQYVCDNLY